MRRRTRTRRGGAMSRQRSCRGGETSHTSPRSSKTFSIPTSSLGRRPPSLPAASSRSTDHENHEKGRRMKNPRIVVVGGGSQFAIGLAESFIDYGQDSLAGTNVVLLDIDEDAVAKVNHFAQRLTDSLSVDMKFEATTNRREAFEGADFVLTTFRPGSPAELQQDETIPRKHGLQGNETVGIGGIFMCCRVVPVLREICADAEEICPDAWFINYTNPTQFVADAIGRISN